MTPLLANSWMWALFFSILCTAHLLLTVANQWRMVTEYRQHLLHGVAAEVPAVRWLGPRKDVLPPSTHTAGVSGWITPSCMDSHNVLSSGERSHYDVQQIKQLPCQHAWLPSAAWSISQTWAIDLSSLQP